MTRKAQQSWRLWESKYPMPPLPEEPKRRTMRCDECGVRVEDHGSFAVCPVCGRHIPHG